MNNYFSFPFWFFITLFLFIIEIIAGFTVYSTYYVAFSELDFGSPTFAMIPLLKELDLDFIDFKNLRANSLEAFIFAVITIIAINIFSILLVKLYYNPQNNKKTGVLAFVFAFITYSLCQQFYRAVSVQIGGHDSFSDLEEIGMETGAFLNPFGFVILLLAISLVTAFAEYNLMTSFKVFSESSRDAAQEIHRKVLDEAGVNDFSGNQVSQGTGIPDEFLNEPPDSEFMEPPPKKRGRPPKAANQ